MRNRVSASKAFERIVACAILLPALAGQEDLWKKEFLEPTGKFRTGIFKSQLKNW